MVELIELRPLVASDIPEVVELEEANQPNPWTEGMFQDELRADNRFYVKAGNERLVGFGGIIVMGEEAHITNLLVDPDRRGEGIGRRIVVDLISRAIAVGGRHLTLEVRAGNGAALELYRSLGMVPVGVRPKYYDDDDALIMWVHDIDSPGFAEQLQ